jgi:hypothetical protein
MSDIEKGAAAVEEDERRDKVWKLMHLVLLLSLNFCTKDHVGGSNGSRRSTIPPPEMRESIDAPVSS